MSVSSATIIRFDQYRAAPPAVISKGGRPTNDETDLNERSVVDPALHPTLAVRPEREQRRARWRRAEAIYRFYNELCEISAPAKIAFQEGGLLDAKQFAHFADDAVALYARRGIAARDLLLTPAPTKRDLLLKRQIRKGFGFFLREYGLSEQVDALLMADQEWLVTHRGHRERVSQ